jgi:uncharacterized protein (TIGR03435 family)
MTKVFVDIDEDFRHTPRRETENVIRVVVMLTLVFLAPVWALAQAPALPPRFDVASVKQDTSGEQPSNNWQASPGRISYQNSQILQLIRAAFGDFSLRAEGFPEWTVSERYDVEVRFPANTPGPTSSQMLLQLLIDRFKMAARRETRQVQVYELVMARPGRTLGPQLKPADSTCAPGPRDAPSECQPRISVSGGTLLFPYSTMAGFARTLTSMQGMLGRPVIDKTGLTGNYSISLTFAGAEAPGPRSPVGGTPAPASDGPSIFTALQEQLGLRLNGAQGPVEFLVIDRIERPTPD